MRDTEPVIKQVTIVGVGLIGGSMGLALRAGNPGISVVGHDRPDVLQRAIEVGAISSGEVDRDTALAGADVVVLAMPVNEIAQFLVSAATRLRDKIVTDVGSIKGPIIDIAREHLPAGAVFIGGHPMTGGERSGVEYADRYLFENATYVLCPPSGGSGDLDSSTAALAEMLESTGARILVMSADKHDRVAAAVSHLPQLLAVALADTISDLSKEDDVFWQLAAGGFRDMTRIATSDFDIWRPVLAGNQASVLDMLAKFAAKLQQVRNMVAAEDMDATNNLFDRARRARESIPRDSKGFLRPLSDVYVHVDDRPGVLATITGSLADREINISDMELLKLREGTGGTFRLSFGDARSAAAAVTVLTGEGFSAFTLDH